MGWPNKAISARLGTRCDEDDEDDHDDDHDDGNEDDHERKCRGFSDQRHIVVDSGVFACFESTAAVQGVYALLKRFAHAKCVSSLVKRRRREGAVVAWLHHGTAAQLLGVKREKIGAILKPFERLGWVEVMKLHGNARAYVVGYWERPKRKHFYLDQWVFAAWREMPTALRPWSRTEERVEWFRRRIKDELQQSEPLP